MVTFTLPCLALFGISRTMPEQPEGRSTVHLMPPSQDAGSAVASDSARGSYGDLDGDGVLDALDICCQTPPGVPVDERGRPVGDLDLDCDVDLADAAVLQDAFTGPLGPCVTEICDNGVDDDNDAFIDCDDFDCLDDPDCW